MVLPPPVGPTMTTPNRTAMVSYSWMIFFTTLGTRCKPRSSITSSTVTCRSPMSWYGTSTPGNRSLTMPKNSGRSSARNFGTLLSRMARMRTISSLRSGFPRFREPAITSTDLTARRP